MPPIVVSEYKHANETLRLTDLRQALYDEGAILMEKVLVNLHGEEHRARRGIEIMRHAMGPSAHLLDCGPGPVSVGQLDSMRIELDQPPVTWKQYFLESASSAPAAAKRYYFHRRAWINDADHICLNLLPPAQAQAAATLIGLSGGNTMSGDRLPDLDPLRLEILKKVLPSAGEAARPVDLFDSDRPSLFALTVRKPFGTWTVAGCFNPGESAPLERVIPLERLGLDPARTYLAHDFWPGTFHGEITRELRLTIPPASVILLALHAKQTVPQVIGTDRHVLQGAMELEGVRWNTTTRSLEGVSLGPPGTAPGGRCPAVHRPGAGLGRAAGALRGVHPGQPGSGSRQARPGHKGPGGIHQRLPAPLAARARRAGGQHRQRPGGAVEPPALVD